MTYHVLAQGSPLAGLRDCLPEYSSACGFLVPETLSVGFSWLIDALVG